VAAIACSHHVLGLDKYVTAERRRNLANLQLDAISSSGFVGYQTFDASEFPIVCRVVESLKTHKVPKLESHHVTITFGKSDDRIRKGL
jgi:hypothetical protein